MMIGHSWSPGSTAGQSPYIWNSMSPWNVTWIKLSVFFLLTLRTVTAYCNIKKTEKRYCILGDFRRFQIRTLYCILCGMIKHLFVISPVSHCSWSNLNFLVCLPFPDKRTLLVRWSFSLQPLPSFSSAPPILCLSTFSPLLATTKNLLSIFPCTFLFQST